MEGFNFGSSYNAAYAPTPKRKQRDDDVDMIPAKRSHQGVSSLTPLMRGAGLRSPGLSPGQRNAFDALRCPRGASVQLAAAAPAVLFAATCATCARTSAAAAACAHCERATCASCARSCEGCGGAFCGTCATTNYAARYERVFCFACDEAASPRRPDDAMDVR